MSAFGEIQLQSSSTPTQIASGLTQLVLDGRLAPGMPIRESTLASELGVSRNTVREAVRLLEHSGVATYELHRGVVVRTPSEADVRDVYRARLAIEVGAVRTGSRSPDLDRLVSAALDELLHALDGTDREATVNADLDFHAALVTAAGSPRLLAAYAPVLNELRLYLTILSRHGGYRDVPRLQSEHIQIADLYLNGKRARASTAIARHITENAGRVGTIARSFAASV